MNLEIENMLQNIDKLKQDTQPQWGTMTAQKMVEHLVNTFKVSNGKIKVQCYSEEKKLPVLKKILMSERPFPKGFQSPTNELIPQDHEYENLEEAKKILREEVDLFYKYFKANPEEFLTNPTFGELNKEEWEQFHKKHLTHHLTQFGVI